LRARLLGKLPHLAVPLAVVLAAGCGNSGSARASSPAGPVIQNTSTTTTNTTNTTTSNTTTQASSSLPNPIRADIFTGASLPVLPLDTERVITFATAPALPMHVSLDTQPSGSTIHVAIEEFGLDPPVVLFEADVRTPFDRTVTPPDDLAGRIRVTDPTGSGKLSISRASVKVEGTAPFGATGFTVFLHVAGDSFAGFGQNNDLASDADVAAFRDALLQGTNSILAQSGIQIDLAGSGSGRLSAATVKSAEPGLLDASGNTVLQSATTPTNNWGTLGKPDTDPQFGNALDVFLVQRTSDDTVGLSAKGPGPAGGFLRGNGLRHSIAITAFDKTGAPRSLDGLQKTLAHEIGHFLGLLHTTELDFTPDDLDDTPFSDKATNDRNGNGILDAADLPTPDSSNLMFPFDAGQVRDKLTQEQIDAMKGWLSINPH
jgi:hypothetical protein